MKTTDAPIELDHTEAIVRQAFELARAAGLEVSRIWLQESVQAGEVAAYVLNIATGDHTARVPLTEQNLRDFAAG